ncbi:MAG: hypothetical protein AABN33_01265 [Acidobacteriota bacterium]
MLKRTAAIAMAVTFLSLAIAPETLAHQRNRRAGYYRPTTTYYSPSAYRGVAGTRYYSQPYYGSTVGTRYYGQQYSGNRDYGQRYYRGRGHSTRNLVLTVAAPAALGAGIGAIAGGGKGAGIGALVGGGGGALFYLLRNRGRRR